MAKKPKESKEEKARRALLDAIRSKILWMHRCVKHEYMNEKANETEEDILYGVNKELHLIDHIFFDLLVDETSAREILKSYKEQLH